MEGGQENKGMSEPEKIQAAKDARDISHSNKQDSERESSNIANEFTRLEVQIAALLLPFTIVFINAVAKQGVAQWIKSAFALGICSIILSLVLGLLHLKRIERFWDEFTNQRFLRFLEWNRAVKKEISFDEALGFHRGISLGRGNMVATPIWTWVLQTIFLGIGVGLLFIIFLAYLFGNGAL